MKDGLDYLRKINELMHLKNSWEIEKLESQKEEYHSSSNHQYYTNVTVYPVAEMGIKK